MVGTASRASSFPAFYMYYTTRDGAKRIDRLAGEIIDLSQSHYGPLDERKRHMYEDHPSPWRAYPIVEIPGQFIRNYTPEALLHDVQDVYSPRRRSAVEQQKVEKRLVRYCVVILMLVCSTNTTHAVKVRSVRR